MGAILSPTVHGWDDSQIQNRMIENSYIQNIQYTLSDISPIMHHLYIQRNQLTDHAAAKKGDRISRMALSFKPKWQYIYLLLTQSDILRCNKFKARSPQLSQESFCLSNPEIYLIILKESNLSVTSESISLGNCQLCSFCLIIKREQ